MVVANPAVGMRVKVVSYHKWNAHERGVIKTLQGTRVLVKFDNDDLPHWHDDDGDPVLCLGALDLNEEHK